MATAQRAHGNRVNQSHVVLEVGHGQSVVQSVQFMATTQLIDFVMYVRSRS